MAEPKTRETDADVHQFLESVADERRRADARAVLAIMQEITGEPLRMWGKSIVGLGHYHYRYASGREGDWFLVGLSPRKAALTLYVMDGFSDYDDVMSRLGTYRTGKSCLYIKRLSDVDEGALRELITSSVAHLKQKYPG